MLFNYVNYALSNDIYLDTVAARSQAEVNQPLGLKLRSYLVYSLRLGLVWGRSIDNNFNHVVGVGNKQCVLQPLCLVLSNGIGKLQSQVPLPRPVSDPFLT